MADFLDYSNLTNIEYRENQSTFYLDGTYVNLPPNCVIETYYDRETNKYSYKFLMLTLINNTDTENENMQVATYVINGSGSVFMAYGNTSKYTPIPKFNRRDFLRRLFQYYISMINDKHHFMIYRPWFEHQLLPSYNTLYLRVKTGENEFVSIPYSGNDGPIIALYNSEGEQVFCSAYKNSGGQIYNSVSSSIYLNKLPGGTYTVKLLRTGKGILSFVGGKYSAAITISETDRYHNSDGTYNPANNTSKWINIPSNSFYLNFEAEFFELNADMYYEDLGTDIKQFPGYRTIDVAIPSYETVKGRIKEIMGENYVYNYSGETDNLHPRNYVVDFYTYNSAAGTNVGNYSCPLAPVEYMENINSAQDVKIKVTAKNHKGSAIEDRGQRIIRDYDASSLLDNLAKYISLGNSYNPGTDPYRRNYKLEQLVYHRSERVTGYRYADFSQALNLDDLQKYTIYIANTFSLLSPSRIESTNQPEMYLSGGGLNREFKINDNKTMLNYSQTFTDPDTGTTKSANIPMFRISYSDSVDYGVYSGKAIYSIQEGDLDNSYNSPSETVQNRFRNFNTYKEEMKSRYQEAIDNGYDKTKENYLVHRTSNSYRYIPLHLIFNTVPQDKLKLTLLTYNDEAIKNNFSVEGVKDSRGHDNYRISLGLTQDKVFFEFFTERIGVPEIGEGAIDYTGYEDSIMDINSWMGARLYRQTSIDINLSEIPVR